MGLAPLEKLHRTLLGLKLLVFLSVLNVLVIFLAYRLVKL